MARDLKLKMEVQLLVKEALAEATRLQGTVKQLTEEVKKSIPSGADYSKTMTDFEKTSKRAALEASLFGNKLGSLKLQQDNIKNTMIDLIDQGIAPESAAVESLKNQYDDITGEIQNYGSETKNLSSAIENLAKTGAALAAAKQVQRWASGAVIEFASAEASADRLNLALKLRNLEAAGPALDNLALKLRDVAGYEDDLIRQLEAELIAQGKSREETEKTIKAAAGLSSVTGDDLATSVGNISMMYAGVSRTLGNLIPELKYLTQEQLEQGKGVDLILRKYEAFIGKSGETQIALARTKSYSDDLAKAFGEAMSPEAKLFAEMLTEVSKALSTSSDGLKDLVGFVTSVVIGALAGLVVKTVAVTAATWGWFGAEMAKNSAMALGNPLLLAGIGAAVASTVAIAALVREKQKEAEELGKGTTATRNATTAYSEMTKAMQDAVTATGNVAAAEAAAAKIRVLQAELYKLQTTASSMSSSVKSSLDRVFVTLDLPVNSKSKNWWEGYKTEAEKFAATMESIKSLTDKDAVNMIMRSKDVQTAISTGSTTALRAALENLNSIDPAIQAKIDKIKKEIEGLQSGTTIKPIEPDEVDPTTQGGRLSAFDREYEARIALARKTGQDISSIETDWYKKRADLLTTFVLEDVAKGYSVEKSLASDLAGTYGELGPLIAAALAKAAAASKEYTDAEALRIGQMQAATAIQKGEADKITGLWGQTAEATKIADAETLKFIESQLEAAKASDENGDAVFKLTAILNMLKAKSEAVTDAEALRIGQMQAATAIQKGEADKIAGLWGQTAEATKIADAETLKFIESQLEAAKASDENGDAVFKLTAILNMLKAAQNAVAWDMANASAIFSASLSETKIDDLELEKNRVIALFKGTGEQKLALAAYYDRVIANNQISEAERAAQAKIEADRKAFEKAKELALQNKDYAAVAGYSFQDKAKDTEVGQMMGFGGVAAVDPTAVLIEAAVEFALSLESVQELLNGFSTALGGAKKIIDPLLGQGTGELVDLLVEIGTTLGQIAAPLITNFVLNLKILTGLINIFIVPALKLLGSALTWLNDNVIVPVGNFFIDAMNGLIRIINNALGWLGVHINELEKLSTTTELAAAEKATADAEDKLSSAMTSLSDTFDEKRSDLEDAYSKNIDSLQNLLELGAIGEQDYASRVTALNEQFKFDMASLDDSETAQLAILEDILKELQDGNLSAAQALALAGLDSYAVGTAFVPKDSVARIHKGERIIPASLNEELMNGDLTFGNSSGGTVVYKTEVYVRGSVLAEDDLADTIDRVQSSRSGRGFARVK